MAIDKRVEYMCTWCGQKVTRSSALGRPSPGQCAKKGKTNDGRAKPHTWVVNRKF